MTTLTAGPDLLLPWSSSEKDDWRYKRMLRNGLLVLVVLAIVIPLLPLEELSREKKEAIPVQLARIVMEKKQLPPVPEKPKVEKKVEPKKEPKKKVEQKKDIAVEKPLPKKPPEKARIIDKVAEARKKAKVSGVLAFQDDLMEMRESLEVDNFNSAPVSKSEYRAATVDRAVLARKVAVGGSGIASVALSRDTGGAALSGRETTAVDNSDAIAVSERSSGGGALQASGRSDESIRRVMDSNKGRIFSLYNRALRQDPSLQGRFVFEMIIDPSGKITDLKLISSELDDDTLNKKILLRVRLIAFGLENVSVTTVNYSFDFVPY